MNRIEFVFHGLLVDSYRRSKKPLQPLVNIHIGSDAVGNAKPLPILSVYICSYTSGNCVIAYGSFVRPGFEKMVSFMIKKLKEKNIN